MGAPFGPWKAVLHLWGEMPQRRLLPSVVTNSALEDAPEGLSGGIQKWFISIHLTTEPTDKTSERSQKHGEKRDKHKFGAAN